MFAQTWSKTEQQVWANRQTFVKRHYCSHFRFLVTRLRGVILYELQATLACYARRKFSAGEISTDHMKSVMKVKCFCQCFLLLTCLIKPMKRALLYVQRGSQKTLNMYWISVHLFIFFTGGEKIFDRVHPDI